MVTMHHESTKISTEKVLAAKIKYTWRTGWIGTTWHWGFSSFCSPTIYGNTSLRMWKLNTRSKTQIIQGQKTWNSLHNSVRNPMPRLEIGFSPWNVFLFWSFWCNLNSGWGSLPFIFYGNIHTQGCKKPADTPYLSPRIPHHALTGFSTYSLKNGRQSMHKPPKGHGPVLICPFHYFFTLNINRKIMLILFTNVNC